MPDLATKLSGRFIVIDGPDGSGKTTQARLLGQWLRGHGAAVCEVRDPGGTAIGDRIRRILLDVNHRAMAATTETMLFMASRAQLAAEAIRPALARGECVLSDRYVSATVAYQGAAGIAAEAVRTVGEFATGGLWPDLTVILDLPAEQGLGRLQAAKATPDRMEAKTAAFHRKVRELFLRQVKQDPSRFAVVDAAGSIEQTQQALRELIEGWPWRS